MNAFHARNIDEDAREAQLARESELYTPFVEQAADWLRGLLSAGDAPPKVGRVLDVGSGAGVAACMLARFFPAAEVVAVDHSPSMLDRVRTRATKEGLRGRITTQLADLPAGFDMLGQADVIWMSNAVHHLGDQQAALNALASYLRPGGVLALAERGLPPRFLPRDIGIGRPGLQARLDAAFEECFSDMRHGLPGSTEMIEDWPAVLARTGLIPTGTRTFLIDLPAPLELPAREYLHTHLARLRDASGDRLDYEDLETLEQLLDTDAHTGILWRPDAFFLAATTLHTARAYCAS